MVNVVRPMGAVIKELKLGANNLPPNARKKKPTRARSASNGADEGAPICEPERAFTSGEEWAKFKSCCRGVVNHDSNAKSWSNDCADENYRFREAASGLFVNEWWIKGCMQSVKIRLPALDI